jgi:flagellar protein FlaG
MSSIHANAAASVSLLKDTPVPSSKVQVKSVVAVNESEGKQKAGSVVGVQPVSKETLEQAVGVINQALKLEQRALSFFIDDQSGRSVIKVLDYETDELIKQIPSEELLKVAQDIKRLQQEMGQSIGVLIDKQV